MCHTSSGNRGPGQPLPGSSVDIAVRRDAWQTAGMNDKVFKILGTLAVLLAGVAAKKATDVGWKAVMASDVPDKPEESEQPMLEIILFGALSGAIMALAKGLAGRQVNSYMAKSTGHDMSDA